MSYILDALKRAEAERDRGAVPTLNTQGAVGAGSARSSSPLLSYVLIGVGVLVVLLLGLLVWRGLGSGEPAAQVQLAQAPATPTPMPAQVQAQARPAPAPVVRKPVVVVAAVPPPAPRPAPMPAPAPAPVQAAPAPVLSMAELPESVRRDLPPLKVGGAMYSDAPASRVLILNGLLLHEGETVQPGLVIESIGMHKATLSQNGQRFSIDY